MSSVYTCFGADTTTKHCRGVLRPSSAKPSPSLERYRKMSEDPLTRHSLAPSSVHEFTGLVLFEHYEASGNLLVVTSDASTIQLEPGDFIVRRMWSTAVVPYIYNSAASAPDGPTS